MSLSRIRDFGNDRQVLYLYLNNTAVNLLKRKSPKCLNTALKHKWVYLHQMSLLQAGSMFNSLHWVVAPLILTQIFP